MGRPGGPRHEALCMQGGEKFSLSIVTPAASLYEGDVYTCQIPTSDGLIGVLPFHAPLMALLGYGILTLHDDRGQHLQFAIDGGFLEIKNNKVVVAANSGQNCEEIDLAAAQEEFTAANAVQASGEAAVQRRMERIQAARTRINFAKK